MFGRVWKGWLPDLDLNQDKQIQSLLDGRRADSI